MNMLLDQFHSRLRRSLGRAGFTWGFAALHRQALLVFRFAELLGLTTKLLQRLHSARNIPPDLEINFV